MLISLCRHDHCSGKSLECVRRRNVLDVSAGFFTTKELVGEVSGGSSIGDDDSEVKYR